MSEHIPLQLVEPIVLILEDLVRRVNARLPNSIGGAHYDKRRYPFASFIANASAESVDLFVALVAHGNAIECSADVVRGNGSILSEMPPIVISKPDNPACLGALLDAVRSYVERQENVIVRELIDTA